MDMLIPAGLALVSGVDFDGPFELEAGAIAFSVHFPAFKVEIVIQYEGAHHAHWEFDLNRPGVARLHRLGGHITVCAHQLLEMTLAKHALEGCQLGRRRAGGQPVHHFINAFDALDPVDGIKLKPDFGADDFSEYAGHRIRLVRR